MVPMPVTVLDTVAEMVAAKPERRRAVVMTMGALHAGHAALIDAARAHVGPAGEVVVTVFVNPLQFGPGEDFTRYPRTWDHDLQVSAEHGADLVFAPTADDMYAAGRDITVDPGPLGDVLEGAMRPGHFRGMLTVVAKLLHLTRADVSVYGEKDYQQLVLIRSMVATLNIPAQVLAAPTVREPDGLALSSRNAYLTAEQRAQAAVIPRATAAATRCADGGGTGADVVAAARAEFDTEPGLTPDYLAVTGPDLGPAPERGTARLLLAVRVGTPRLLDNVALHLDPR